MTPLRAALAAAVLLASGLARADAPRCSIRDADDWREYRSAHFDVASDVGAKRAGELVSRLETLRSLVVTALLGEQLEVPGRTRVVAFSRREQFEELAPRHAAGYVKHSWEGPMAVVPVDDLDADAETIAHELAHLVSWHVFPRQPRWFTEGLAIFAQTVGSKRVDEGAATGTHLVRGSRVTGGRWAGLAPRALLLQFAASPNVPARELLAWGGGLDHADPVRFHASSWLLYHYLWNERSQAFTAFQERLGRAEEPAAAWRLAFPDLDPADDAGLARLDDALAGYRKSGRYLSYRVDVAAPDAAFATRPLPRADVHALFTGARASPPSDDALRAEAAEALREDPHHPLWILERAARDGASPVAALRETVRAAPEDWRGWYLLAESLHGEGAAAEREAALRRAVALNRDAARAHEALASLLVETGRVREARPFAERALDLAPWEPAVVDTLARVAIELGQCKPALVLQRRAASLAFGAAGEEIRARVAEYEGRCAVGRVAPATERSSTAAPPAR